MFERILVPLDGSPRSEQAVALAAHIARAHHSSIILLRSVEILSIYSMQTVGMMEHIQRLEEQGALNYLNHIKASSMLEHVPTTTQIYVGSPALAILDVVKQHNIDLVVLCSHGYTGLKRWALGSVAQRIARSCPVPVLIQRDEHPLPFNAQPTEQAIFRVCVPLDGSPQAEVVIEPALAIAAACAPPQHAEIQLLRIIEPLSPSNEENFREIYNLDLQELISQQTQTYLQDVVKRLQQTAAPPDGIEITGCLSTSADIAQEIIQYAEESDNNQSCQLLAMTTHGRDKLDRWISGSIAERILTQTRLPLLIVRPPLPNGINHAHQQDRSTV
ncbi:hypothetical protein KDW_48630 [Dictyobacter vulcani]|uniref:UspA domain-containing protein n=1 Tax=Dictyobacter vulcani TaxID=2607529 RepID=A0A5J4KW43_9CHLR|nr:universal stress protein [Dictyobacter vulcani]GER90701.1 hypothetical protein KDW_48630 [Dictyobacter vulcani]